MTTDFRERDRTGGLKTDDLPWERPGAVRRDCELHRGPLIQRLGFLSWLFSILSWFGGLSAVLGLGFGIVTLVMASRDLDKMRAGLMDPDGLSQTKRGRSLAIMGTTFSLLCGVPLSLILLAHLAHDLF